MEKPQDEEDQKCTERKQDVKHTLRKKVENTQKIEEVEHTRRRSIRKKEEDKMKKNRKAKQE